MWFHDVQMFSRKRACISCILRSGRVSRSVANASRRTKDLSKNPCGMWAARNAHPELAIASGWRAAPWREKLREPSSKTKLYDPYWCSESKFLEFSSCSCILVFRPWQRFWTDLSTSIVFSSCRYLCLFRGTILYFVWLMHPLLLPRIFPLLGMAVSMLLLYSIPGLFLADRTHFGDDQCEGHFFWVCTFHFSSTFWSLPS